MSILPLDEAAFGFAGTGAANECLEKSFRIARPIVTLAIDEESGCAVNAGANSRLKIFAHPRAVFSAEHLFDETLGVEVKLLGQGENRFVTERILILEEGIVHFPESALRARGLRPLGRVLGMRMH